MCDFPMTDLPKVSVLTLYNKNTYDFTDLMIYNINNFKYNKKLLEWIIYDDSKKSLTSTEILEIKDKIKPIKLTYNHSNNKKSKGSKRNELVKLSNYKHLINMDYDKIYFPTYIIHSINKLKETKSGLVGTLNMIHIYPELNYSTSYLKVYSNRQMYEETMCFTKKYSMSMGGFSNTNIGEGSKLIDFSNKISTTEPNETMLFICYSKHKNKFNDYLFDKQVFIKINEDYINILNNIFNVTYDKNDIRNFKKEKEQKERELNEQLEKEQKEKESNLTEKESNLTETEDKRTKLDEEDIKNMNEFFDVNSDEKLENKKEKNDILDDDIEIINL